VAQVNALAKRGPRGADRGRSPRDAEALAEVRAKTRANLGRRSSGEIYRLAEVVARMSTKFATTRGIFIIRARKAVAGEGSLFWPTWPGDSDCAIRVGVNCGSVRSGAKDRYAGTIRSPDAG